LITFALVTDLHFGPEASFGGKLRKLSHQAPVLAREFAVRMREQVRPDLIVNLGDDIEDESHDADSVRYRECLAILREAGIELVHVAGNHDRVHLSSADLREAWGMPREGVLYRSFGRCGVHFMVLATHEQKDRAVTIDDEQLGWVEEDLAIHAGEPVVILMHHSAADQDLRGNRWFEGAPHLCLVRERERLRALFEAHGGVRAVFNGHLHWNHFDCIASIPYITIQSLIENVDDSAPGRAAAAHAVVHLDDAGLLVNVYGEQPARYQISRA